jgi:hypothetical protein
MLEEYFTKQEIEGFYDDYINCYHNSRSWCKIKREFCPENSKRMEFCRFYYVRHRYWYNWFRMLWRIIGKIPFYLKLKPILEEIRRKREQYRENLSLLKNILEGLNCFSCKKNLVASHIARNILNDEDWTDYFLSVITGMETHPTEKNLDFKFICCDCFRKEVRP